MCAEDGWHSDQGCPTWGGQDRQREMGWGRSRRTVRYGKELGLAQRPPEEGGLKIRKTLSREERGRESD